MRTRLAVGALIAGTAIASAEPGLVPVEITARPITSFTINQPDASVGTMEFRGGFSLSSRFRDFGAFSGIDFLPDGTLIAIADTGFWMTARLVEEDGWLRGVTDVRVGPMLDTDGGEANLKDTTDAEGLRLMPGGQSLMVSFEQHHRLSVFPIGADIGLSIPSPAPFTLPDLSVLRSNRGIEAVAIAPETGPLGGATVIFSEEGLDGNGGLRAWVLGGPRAGSFAVRRDGHFDITDAAFLPNGDLFILERRLSMSEGIAMQIRRLSAEDIRPGRTVDGPVVLYDDHLFQIDNMEGMALRELPSGEVLITLVSDNNHSLLQRNLILQFLWRETIPPLPRERPGG